MFNNKKKVQKYNNFEIFNFLISILKYEKNINLVLLCSSIFMTALLKAIYERLSFDLSRTLIEVIYKPKNNLANTNLFYTFIFYIIFLLSDLIIYFLRQKLNVKIYECFQVTLRLRLQKLILNKDYQFFIQNNKQKIIDQADNLITRSGDLLTDIIDIFESILSIFTSLILMLSFLINYEIPKYKTILYVYCFSFIILILLVATIIFYYMQKIILIGETKNKKSAEIDVFFADQINNINIIHAFGHFNQEAQNFQDKITNYFWFVKKFESINTFCRSISSTAAYAMHIIELLSIQFLLTKYNTISILHLTQIISFINFSLKNMYGILSDINMSFRDIKNTIEDRGEVKQSLEFFFPINNSTHIINENYDLNLCEPYCIFEPMLEEEKWELSLENIDFYYKVDNINKYILNDINLKINFTDKIGIVGQSGCGKTTLANIILGLCRPSNGIVKFGPYIQQNMKRCCWLKLFAYIPQTPTLFNRTIRDNIIMNEMSVTKDDLYQAAMAADCRFIYDKDLKYDFIVGYNGEKLSGGQRQRIALARAFLRQNAKCILADEATSALDANSETKLNNNLNKLFKNKTVLLIAHRFSTLIDSTKIIFLEEGRVSNFDTPKTIYNENINFKSLCDEQSFVF
jgi:ABC-type multidrug transport system fused ATPase/permease subunit